MARTANRGTMSASSPTSYNVMRWRLCKKSLIALIMSGVLYFLPYFPMKLGGVLGEWMFIFPIWSAKAQWVLRTAEHKLVNLLPLSCEMPVWIVIFTLIFTVVSFLITCKSFSEYQGT